MSETTTTIMSNGSTPAVSRPDDSLNLWSLKSVSWLQTNPVLNDGYSFVKTQTDKARQYRIVEAISTLVLFQLSLLETIIHTIPWPSSVINIVHKIDDVAEKVLEYTYRTLEWWFDYITIQLMRAIETVVIYLDKFITAIDSVISWFIQRYDWVFEIVVKIYGRVQAVWSWYTSLLQQTWTALRSGVQSLQQTWALSQEEMMRNEQDQETSPEADGAEASVMQLRIPPQFGSDKRLSFSGVDEWDDGVSSGNISPLVSRSHLYRGSDSEGSDVAAVQETSKLCVGEQTGRSYKRVQTSATVVGRRREAMHDRVNSKLQVMRKNSIRFSRGMDVKVSRMIASAQKQFTPSSVMSTILSIIKFFILFPFKVIMWLVGAKRLSRRSRAMRSESQKRREAAAAGRKSAFVAVYKDSSRTSSDLPTRNGTARDSGISEDVPEFSEDSNGSTTSSVARVNGNGILALKNEKFLSISSTSTISEEPDEKEVENDLICSTSPATPPHKMPMSNPNTPRLRHKLPSKIALTTQQASSEPDLTSILVTKDMKRRSLGAVPDEFSPLGSRRTKKRVSIQ